MSPTGYDVLRSSLDPRPISDSLRRHLDDTLAQIPSGKSGGLTTAITTKGFQVSAAQRWRGLKVSGWAGREWGTGWLAGTQAAVTW